MAFRNTLHWIVCRHSTTRNGSVTGSDHESRIADGRRHGTVDFPGTGVIATAVYVIPVSLICWLVLKYTMGLRVSREEEIDGLDHGEHGNEAYPDFVTKAAAH